MTGIEIILIIIGFACICISFFVSTKKYAVIQAEEDGVQSASVWSPREEEMIRERVQTIMTEQENRFVDETEDQMGRLCNEKIMAIDEFSQQLLEKIDNNHQEVVFMYNMLNEKEKDIKQLMTESVQVPVVERPVERTVERPVEANEVLQESPIQPQQKSRAETGTRQISQQPLFPEKKKKPGQKRPQTAIELMSERAQKEKKDLPQKASVASSADSKGKSSGIPSANVNLQIQKMYKEGKSVLEISRELNIGQGEVKLVIALYGGRK